MDGMRRAPAQTAWVVAMMVLLIARKRWIRRVLGWRRNAWRHYM